MNLNSAISAVPTLLVIWACLTACFVGLLTYRGQLTRYEDEQLYLAETETSVEGERHQSEVVRRIRKVEPYVRFFGAAATLVTVSIVAIWTYDAWRSLH